MKVLLIDDHTLFAQSLALALKQFRKDLLTETINRESDLSRLQNGTNFDVILLDIKLGKNFSQDGFELAKAIRKLQADAKILMLTGFDLPVYEYRAEQLGVNGFVNKNIEADKLLRIIDLVAQGGTYFSKKTNFRDELTDREKEILTCLGKGEKRKDIAQRLFISERTLTNHIQSILDKLEVDSTIKAIVKARKLGYLS